MNKTDIVDYISANYGKTKKDVNLIIDSFLEQIASALKNDEKVSIKYFGTFSKSITKPFDIYSPYDGKLIKNVIQTRIHFKSSPNLIKLVTKSNNE